MMMAVQRTDRHNLYPFIVNFGIACCHFCRQSDREVRFNAAHRVYVPANA